MSVIEKLKTESMKMRKERDPLAPKLVFALSEIDKVGKNAGNRPTTEDEAIKVIQKITSTIDQTIALISPNSSAAYDLQREKQILEALLPSMASHDEIMDVIRPILTGKTKETMPKKGDIMKAVRDKFGAKVDMKYVGQILLDTYGI